MKNRIVSNVAASKRSRIKDAAPFPGGFSWGRADNAPGRVKFADDVVRLNHTGWFCDPHQEEKARGIVVALPHGRFLAGIEFDSRGVSECALQVFDTARDAAHDADEQARHHARVRADIRDTIRDIRALCKRYDLSY